MGQKRDVKTKNRKCLLKVGRCASGGGVGPLAKASLFFLDDYLIFVQRLIAVATAPRRFRQYLVLRGGGGEINKKFAPLGRWRRL